MKNEKGGGKEEGTILSTNSKTFHGLLVKGRLAFARSVIVNVIMKKH